MTTFLDDLQLAKYHETTISEKLKGTSHLKDLLFFYSLDWKDCPSKVII